MPRSWPRLAEGLADLASLAQATLLRIRANLTIRNAMVHADNIAGKRIGQDCGAFVIALQGPVASVPVNGSDQQCG